MTLKGLRARYPSLTIVPDVGAPDEMAKAELRRKLRDVDRDLVSSVHGGQFVGDPAPLIVERTALWRELQRYRVKLFSGRTPKAAGVVVGQGDTQAAALKDAAKRLGRA